MLQLLPGCHCKPCSEICRHALQSPQPHSLRRSHRRLSHMFGAHYQASGALSGGNPGLQAEHEAKLHERIFCSLSCQQTRLQTWCHGRQLTA